MLEKLLGIVEYESIFPMLNKLIEAEKITQRCKLFKNFMVSAVILL